MRSTLPLPLFIFTYLLLFVPIVVSQQRAQVFFFPPPPVRPGNDAPTLTSQQAHAVIQQHIGASVADIDTPEDHGLWGHFMGWWEDSRRARVLIVEGVDVQHVFGTNAPKQPTFYLDTDDASVLDEFYEAAREAVEKILKLPLVKTLLDTLDWAVEGASKSLAEELTALVALADSLWTSASGKFDAVAIRLGSIAEGSELWKTAVKGIKGGVESMTAKPDSAPVVLVIMPGAQGGRHYHKRASENGAVHATKTIDISASFIILALTTLLLVIGSIASISLLFSLGSESLPSTLNLTPGK